MVPKKGLEPPHPCGYMDLNHARLPIPPLRLEVRRINARRSGRKRTSSILNAQGEIAKIAPAERDQGCQKLTRNRRLIRTTPGKVAQVNADCDFTDNSTT